MPAIDPRQAAVVWAFAMACWAASAGRAQTPPPDLWKRCEPCHQALRAQLEASVVHEPFKLGACGGCHNPHASRHDHLLVSDSFKTCGRCHPATSEERRAAVVHEPFGRGACSSCHAGHTSPHEALLKQPPGELCRGCHAPKAVEGVTKPEHAPVREGRCGACHDAHASGEPALLARSSAELCGSCHPADAAHLRAHGGLAVGALACTACHLGHRSDDSRLLRATMHQPVAERRCEACHRQEAGTTVAALKAPVPELCRECHPPERWSGAVGHGPVRDGRCLACHDAHASPRKALLVSAPADLCVSCHARSVEAPGGKRLHPRFAARDCLACHEAHAGDFASLTRQRKWLQLCESCHKRHAHAVDVAPSDKVQIAPDSRVRLDDLGRVSCLGCHAAHASDHESLLYYEKGRALCVACHRQF